MVVTTISFDNSDQERFAMLSGDYNPMHVDALVARRFMFGGVVVHGIHLLLKGLELIVSERREPLNLQSVSAVFHQPVFVGSPAKIVLKSCGDGEALVHVMIGASLVTVIRVSFERGPANEVSLASENPAKQQSQVLAESDISTAKGQVPALLCKKLSTELFPELCRYIPDHQIAVLLASTRIVGMKCPGYSSIFAELSVEFSDVIGDSEFIRYAVEKYDTRFRLATINIFGVASKGTLKAILRPPPQRQATSSELCPEVTRNEFRERRALVVGGSRGLGELAAKLLGAGGADVRLTYQGGEIDAADVVSDIRSNGGTAAAIQYDVNDGGAVLVDRLGTWEPSHLLYFATPPIFRPRHEEFSAQLFNEFSRIYVTGFANTFFPLADNGALQSVIYPSTIAISDLSSGMPEYIAAKSSAEVFCQYLGKAYPDIGFNLPRLPRLPTDQTVNLIGVTGDDPIPLMLELLRSSCGA